MIVHIYLNLFTAICQLPGELRFVRKMYFRLDDIDVIENHTHWVPIVLYNLLDIISDNFQKIIKMRKIYFKILYLCTKVKLMSLIKNSKMHLRKNG